MEEWQKRMFTNVKPYVRGFWAYHSWNEEDVDISPDYHDDVDINDIPLPWVFAFRAKKSKNKSVKKIIEEEYGMTVRLAWCEKAKNPMAPHMKRCYYEVMEHE